MKISLQTLHYIVKKVASKFRLQQETRDLTECNANFIHWSLVRNMPASDQIP